MIRYILFFVWMACSISLVSAKVELPAIFSSNMVLQQSKPILIWGRASAGEVVNVRLKGDEKETVADDAGTWKIKFPAQTASFDAFDIVVEGENVIRLENVLVGEVWLCSGQSNMEYSMKLRDNYRKPGKGVDLTAEELKKPANPKIRLFLVERKKGQTVDVGTKGWEICDAISLAPFSAPGYFFGKELLENVNVPIGLISSSWGGSRIEPWTPADAYRHSPLFSEETSNDDKVNIDNSPVGEMYEGMIRPLAPFPIRGFIWYQGESNVMFHDARYYEKQKLLIDAWREIWQDTKMPFYYVQLAPYYYTKRKDKVKHTPETLPWFWEIQTRCMDIPYSGMAVVTDLVDDLSDIHPSYKWEVGRRLALWALAKDYGKKDVVYSGPQLKRKKIRKDKIILEFSHVGSGLKQAEEALTWFEIAGKDGKYVPAEAVIDGNKVVVSAKEISKPRDVRFAWNETARPNFFNNEGLPAMPFRTDR